MEEEKGYENSMKITIEDIGPGEEDEIIIRCRNLDSHFLELIYGLKMKTRKISGSRNGNISMISPKDRMPSKINKNKTQQGIFVLQQGSV